MMCVLCGSFFFFQAEDGIRDLTVTGVQTCALPISRAIREHQYVQGVRKSPARPRQSRLRIHKSYGRLIVRLREGPWLVRRIGRRLTLCNRRGRGRNPGRSLAPRGRRHAAANYYRALRTPDWWWRHSSRAGRRRAAYNYLSRRRPSSTSRFWRARHSSRLEQRYGSVQHLVAEYPANCGLSLQDGPLGFQPTEDG